MVRTKQGGWDQATKVLFLPVLHRKASPRSRPYCTPLELANSSDQCALQEPTKETARSVSTGP